MMMVEDLGRGRILKGRNPETVSNGRREIDTLCFSLSLGQLIAGMHRGLRLLPTQYLTQQLEQTSKPLPKKKNRQTDRQTDRQAEREGRREKTEIMTDL